jgi:aminoglycoside/choline kinase family phosphotransferase
MATGSTGLPENDAALLLHALGENRSCVESYLRPPVTIARIAGGGSDRQFYRLSGPDKAVVLLVAPPEDQEFLSYVEIARFLHSLGVGAPELYDVFPDAHLLIMEDLGDTSLYDLLRDEPSEEALLSWYERALDLLALLQVEGRKEWDSCPRVVQRAFDYSALRWETDYFCTSFLSRYCNIAVAEYKGLDHEFDVLAKKIAAEPLFLMHRDFQSQNILIHENKLRVIDFQSARKGLLQYDLASLLKDSYLILPEAAQQQLVSYYIEKLNNRGITIPDNRQFRETFSLAGLQRNMQALGAFAFLAGEKGKTWFEQYIPAGVGHLKAALAKRTDFPVLHSLVERIAGLLSRG